MLKVRVRIWDEEKCEFIKYTYHKVTGVATLPKEHFIDEVDSYSYEHDFTDLIFRIRFIDRNGEEATATFCMDYNHRFRITEDDED